jgi:hypothetical protein
MRQAATKPTANASSVMVICASSLRDDVALLKLMVLLSAETLAFTFPFRTRSATVSRFEYYLAALVAPPVHEHVVSALPGIERGNKLHVYAVATRGHLRYAGACD